MKEQSTGALDVAHKTPRELRAFRLVQEGDAAALENLADAGMRHRRHATMKHAVGSILEIARAFTAGTTRDGSWGELEKRFAIMASSIVKLRQTRRLLLEVIHDLAGGREVSEFTICKLRKWHADYKD